MPSRDKASFKVGWNSDNIFLKTINSKIYVQDAKKVPIGLDRFLVSFLGLV